MEKKSLYIVIAIIVVAALVLSFGNLTGRGTIGECIDSDGAGDPYIAGSVSFTESNKVYKDECFSKGGIGVKDYLRERYCLVKMENELYKCETGCLENANGEGYCEEGEARKIES